MAKCTFKGLEFTTTGDLPHVGDVAPDFTLISSDLVAKTLKGYGKKRKVLNIFPSIDTTVCAKSVRRFNTEAATYPDVAVLNISLDLPFAHKRFCGAEGIERSEALSGFRSSFGEDYGVTILNGPLEGLYSRAVLVLDENDRILHAEHVCEIAQEPAYESALQVLKNSRPTVQIKS